MKKILILGITAVLLCAGLMASTAAAVKPGTDFNGPHYTLNLLGKGDDFANDNGRVIFVPETGDYQIFMKENSAITDINVVDGNACLDGRAEIELPEDKKYEVYVVSKGKPKIDDTIINGVYEIVDTTGTSYAIPTGTIMLSDKKWSDATGLFYVDSDDLDGYLDVALDIPDSIWVFDIGDYLTGEYSFLDYYWGVSNNGKIVQVRFYPVG